MISTGNYNINRNTAKSTDTVKPELESECKESGSYEIDHQFDIFYAMSLENRSHDLNRASKLLELAKKEIEKEYIEKARAEEIAKIMKQFGVDVDIEFHIYDGEIPHSEGLE
jgi:hypothetical protein